MFSSHRTCPNIASCLTCWNYLNRLLTEISSFLGHLQKEHSNRPHTVGSSSLGYLQSEPSNRPDCAVRQTCYDTLHEHVSIGRAVRTYFFGEQTRRTLTPSPSKIPLRHHASILPFSLVAFLSLAFVITPPPLYCTPLLVLDESVTSSCTPGIQADSSLLLGRAFPPTTTRVPSAPTLLTMPGKCPLNWPS